VSDATANAPPAGLATLAAALAGGRVAIGAGLWLAPQLASRALGFGRLDARSLALARIAASRDLVLGVWGVSALGDPAALRRAATAAAVADAGDAVAFALLLGSGEHRRAAIRGVLAATPAALAGFWLGRGLTRA
jgi:hypothetical protein